jgi:hypothetical protein
MINMDVITIESTAFLELEAKNLIAKYVNEQQYVVIENSDESWVDNYDICTFLKIYERTLQRLQSKGPCPTQLSSANHTMLSQK